LDIVFFLSSFSKRKNPFAHTLFKKEKETIQNETREAEKIPQTKKMHHQTVEERLEREDIQIQNRFE